MKNFLTLFTSSMILVGGFASNANAADCSAAISSNLVVGCAVPAGGVTINSGVSVDNGPSSGAIYAIQSGSIGPINNYGSLTGSNVNQSILVFESSLTGGISNFSTGILRGTNNAIWITAGNAGIATTLTGGIYNAGQILDTGEMGIEITSASVSGGITNTSTGKINGAKWGIGLSNYYSNNAVLNGGINNSGEISGNAADGIALTRSDANYTTVINGGITNNATGTIFSYAGGNGINVTHASSSIDFITNYGSIYGATGAYYGINNNGYIGTLNNAQGAGNTHGVLTYTGNLPTKYNIIINSATHYGQLAVADPAGSITTFGIYGAPFLTSRTYAGVLTNNVTVTNLQATYDNMTLALVNNALTGTYDLMFTGASLMGTQQSLVNTANALAPIYAMQNAVLVNSFTYDCTLFDVNNICISVGGRNTQVSAANGLNNTSALLIAAYRPHPNYRIGAYADQNLSVNNAGSTVSLTNSTPLIGIFGAWTQNQEGTGAEVRVSAAYGQKDTTITRQVVGLSEPGSGSSTLNSQGAQVTAKYGFAVTDKTIVSPYVGVRYTQNNMNGYTEGSSATVTAPLTYGALNTNATTALAGVGASYQVIPAVTTFASAGVETDTNTANGTYSATGINGLTPVNFNANPVRTRPTATVGAYYDIAKNQRFGVTGIYRQEAYQAVSTTTVMATYTIGL